MRDEKQMTIFGLRLQELMDERGLSNKRLGGICGVTEKTIIRWKYYYSGPKLCELLFLAKFFNVSIDYMAGQTNLRKVRKEDWR